MMLKYIALLRGINVGGHKKFPKAEQLETLQDLGLKNPQVYIHTGNWIFESDEKAGDLSLKISEAVLKKYGWEVPVIVMPAKDFKTVFDNAPFIDEKKEKSYFTLFGSVPSEENITALRALKYENEEFHVSPSCIYTYYLHGAGKAKLTNNVMEKKLKVSATTRNFKTMTKILALIN